jgi:hypothetical protein
MTKALDQEGFLFSGREHGQQLPREPVRPYNFLPLRLQQSYCADGPMERWEQGSPFGKAEVSPVVGPIGARE